MAEGNVEKLIMGKRKNSGIFTDSVFFRNVFYGIVAIGFEKQEKIPTTAVLSGFTLKKENVSLL